MDKNLKIGDLVYLNSKPFTRLGIIDKISIPTDSALIGGHWYRLRGLKKQTEVEEIKEILEFYSE